MSYRDLEAGRGSAREPRHAAPPGISGPVLFRQWLQVPGPLPRKTHQALRLVGTAGMWAAGLCLVIGSIALVVSTGTHAPSRLTTTAEHAEPGGSVRAPTVSARSPRERHGSASLTVAGFSGRGDMTTRPFSVRPGSRWELRWSYSCPARPLGSQFIVADEDTALGKTALGPSISESGARGHGTTWLAPGGGDHHLMVISTCSWHMTVAEPS